METRSMEKEIREVWALFKETDRQLRLNIKHQGEQQKETDRQIKETDRRQKETGKQIKELGKQIGGLGNKFGGFTEGMAFPSMKRILIERFGMEYISPRVLVRKNGDSMELDVLAYSNRNKKEVYVVEVKSRLKDDDINNMLDDLKRFPQFFPEHNDKDLYGIISAVDINEQMKKKVLDTGLYLGVINDETFTLEVPEEFKAKKFNERK